MNHLTGNHPHPRMILLLILLGLTFLTACTNARKAVIY